MSLKSFSLNIITPQTTLDSFEDITMVVCPGIEGDLGIMAGHLPLITMLRSGKIHVFKEKDKIFEISIDAQQNGILNVTPQCANITLEEFCPLRFDLNLQGVDYLRTPLRIESAVYGEYKIDREVLSHLTPEHRQKLQHYISHHKGSHITLNLMQEIGDKAA